MAHYTVTHTCGHDSSVFLVGKETERQSKLAWMAKQPCLDCKHEKELAKAQETEQAQKLPSLIGSTEQGRAWAATIRIQEIDECEKKLRSAEESDQKRLSPEALEKSAKVTQRAHEILEDMRKQTSASWWLNHKDGGCYAEIRATLRKEFANK